MKLKLTVAAAALLLAGLAVAQPSEYFLWKHKVTGQTTCEAQVADEDAWVKVSGPYRDANCKRPVSRLY